MESFDMGSRVYSFNSTVKELLTFYYIANIPTTWLQPVENIILMPFFFSNLILTKWHCLESPMCKFVYDL